MNKFQLFAARNYADGDMAHHLIDLDIGEPLDGDPVVNTAACGDTLFEFVISELGDLENTREGQEEAARRMESAAAQLQALANEIYGTDFQVEKP